MIIDVAVTGVDDQSRTSDEAVDRPLQARYDKKMAKYGRVADQNSLRFIPAVFLMLFKLMASLKLLLKSKFGMS